jgi:hypothetical protein
VFWRRHKLKVIGPQVVTEGLAKRAHPELRVAVDDPELLDGAKALLRFVLDYLERSGRVVAPGETLRYGYWLVKFVSGAEPGVLDAWEYDAEAESFVPGAGLAIRYWEGQRAVCRRNNAVFAPPNPDAMTAASKGVLEGRPVQGLRYPWPDHMSGWLLVTDEYDGDPASLTRHHTYHLTAARPDLAPFLALPPGFGFDLRGGGVKVWYDEAALREHLEAYGGEAGLTEAGFDPPPPTKAKRQ